jgi:hypothetical protein
VENWKWQQAINIKDFGKLEKKMAQVFLIINLGLYIFANGDVYEGEF